jgi:hypothetical protein
MASKITEDIIGGDLLIFDEIKLYLDWGSRKIKYARELVSQGLLDMSQLVEQAMVNASHGKLIHVPNGKGLDFTDGSDAKKATVFTFSDKGGLYRKARINSIKNKNLLRIIVADSMIDECYFFLVSIDDVKKYRKVSGANASFTITFAKEGGDPIDNLYYGSFNDFLWSKCQKHSFSSVCQ